MSGKPVTMTGTLHDSLTRDGRSVSALVSDLSEQVSRLVRDEFQLAQLELRGKAKSAGTGAGLIAAAAGIALFAAGALVACLILLLALVLPAWASALIVGVVLLAAAAVVGLIGRAQLRKSTPPMPSESIDGIKADIQTVKEHAHR